MKFEEVGGGDGRVDRRVNIPIRTIAQTESFRIRRNSIEALGLEPNDPKMPAKYQTDAWFR